MTTANPKVVKPNSTSDLLASLLQLMNYQPKNSVVVFPMNGNRINGAARFDIPEETLEDIQQTVSVVITTALVTKRAIIVCYTDAKLPHAVSDGEPILETKLLALIQNISIDEDIELGELLLVGENGWLDMLDKRAELRPLQEITMQESYPKEPLQTVEEWRASKGQKDAPRFASYDEITENLKKLKN